MGDWLYYLGGIALGLGGLALLGWALFADRSRGRKRCGKCWYDMTGIEGEPPWTCPECGKVIRRAKKLHKTRRRWRWAIVGLFAFLLGTPLLLPWEPILSKTSFVLYTRCTNPSPATFWPAIMDRVGGRTDGTGEYFYTNELALPDWEWRVLARLARRDLKADPTGGRDLCVFLETGPPHGGDALAGDVLNKVVEAAVVEAQRDRRLSWRQILPSPWRILASRDLATTLSDAERVRWIETLRPLVDHTDPYVRTGATVSLSMYGSDPPLVSSDYLPGLDDDFVHMRAACANALGALGSRAEDVTPRLIRMLLEDHEIARCEAAEALGAIGCVDADVVAALVEAASGSEYDSVRWRAALSLLAVGEERRLALETLVGCFVRGDSGYREHAAREIKRIAPLVAEWLPAFQAIADDPGEYGYIRSHAEGIIREIENPRWGCSLSIDGWTFELSPKHPSIPESDPGE